MAKDDFKAWKLCIYFIQSMSVLICIHVASTITQYKKSSKKLRCWSFQSHQMEFGCFSCDKVSVLVVRSVNYPLIKGHRLLKASETS